VTCRGHRAADAESVVARTVVAGFAGGRGEALAEGEGAGLIVVGSRGRLGVPALASTSERVAHLAPCSVLVMPGR
jgi:nucleotide-binding universal stress UspA family protein